MEYSAAMTGARYLVGCLAAAAVLAGCGSASPTRTVTRTVRAGTSTGGGLHGSSEGTGSTQTMASALPHPDSGDVLRVMSSPGPSMVPTLRIGQKFNVDFSKHTPALGDVIVFHPPEGATPSNAQVQASCGDPSQGFGKAQPCARPSQGESSQTFVKRVVGLPGDVLRITKGHVYRNGTEEPGSYVQPCAGGYGQCTFPKPIRVPAGMYYVMGDNRGVSDDSRFWGPVRASYVLGIVVR